MRTGKVQVHKRISDPSREDLHRLGESLPPALDEFLGQGLRRLPAPHGEDRLQVRGYLPFGMVWDVGQHVPLEVDHTPLPGHSRQLLGHCPLIPS